MGTQFSRPIKLPEAPTKRTRLAQRQILKSKSAGKPSRRSSRIRRRQLLEKLPTEIWLMVFEELPKSSLFNVCLTCSTLHSLATPVLWRSLDFSVARVPTASGLYFVGDFRPQPEHLSMMEKQLRFTLSLLRRPVYGQRILQFKWSFGLETVGEWPQWAEEIRSEWMDNHVYTMLTLLTHVQTIELDSVGRWLNSWRPVTSSFPIARKFVISGTRGGREFCKSLVDQRAGKAVIDDRTDSPESA